MVVDVHFTAGFVVDGGGEDASLFPLDAYAAAFDADCVENISDIVGTMSDVVFSMSHLILNKSDYVGRERVNVFAVGEVSEHGFAETEPVAVCGVKLCGILLV